jgi:regulation of enolase protein 1 (concanavalin A-like superfamily)
MSPTLPFKRLLWAAIVLIAACGGVVYIASPKVDVPAKGKLDRSAVRGTRAVLPALQNQSGLSSKPPVLVSELEDFQGWTRRYLTAEPEARRALEDEGRALAIRRRAWYKEVIQSDPQQALEAAVPMVVRQALPAGVVAQLEQRIAGRGVIRSYWAAPETEAETTSPPVLRYAELENGETLRAHVYGRRAEAVGWTMNASLNGVAIDGHFAVNESPIRRLEIGEKPDSNKVAVEVCPISGIRTQAPPAEVPVTAGSAVLEAYGEIVYLCDGSHTLLYEQSLIYGEASSGGAQGFTGILPSAPTPSVGVVKVLCIPAIFADQGQVPASEATMLNMLRETGDFYQVTSYGRLTLQATVIPPVTLPRNQAWYFGKDSTSGFIKEVDGLGIEMTHAKEEARKMGYDWQDYHCTILRSNGGARSPTSYGGGGNVWMRSDSTSTCSHEIGHAFGLAHANFWQTNGASVIGPGGNVEYGDIYDNMGSTSPPNGHWNVQAKNQIKWLPDEFVPPITRSGTYRVFAFDSPRLEPGRLYGLRLQKDQNRTYWAEYRTLFSTNNWATNGLLLGWKWPANSGGNLQLLDTTPGSPNDRTDAAITVGRTFSDLEAGLHLTTLAVNTETVPHSLDVRVNFGMFPGNQPPLATLTASSVVPTNHPVTFTVTASDPDGDELSYGWIWPDSTISPNAASVTRTFTTSGIYTLNCVVSDMKGGSAIRNAVITVGNGNSRFTISGRITKEGLGLGGINVSTSGTNGTLTDSDGYYTLSNLTAGTYTVTPAVHGFLFNELFNNSISVGPSFSGADFTVDELPILNITAINPVASEGGGSGTFRISRTGSTALPLSVYVFAAQGTAVKTSDYALSPDYTAVTSTPWQAFTIPAEAGFLDVAVVPVNDVLQEGFEAVTLVLGQDASFAPGTSLSATVGIVDNDTPLPTVSLTANLSQVDEGGGESVICTVRRTGPVTSALNVNYAVATISTARSGEDFVALPGVVTIPAGQSSATFEISPVNDSLSEVTEGVRIDIATSAVFIADAAERTVVMRIVDDDTQVVTVTATDAVATEMDLTESGAQPDPGTFLLTRSGDLSSPLIVYYSVAGTALHGADYEALPGRVEFAAGETRAAVSIMPILDGFGEAPETVMLSLAAGNGNYLLGESYVGTVTIQDPGGSPILELAASSNSAAEPTTNGTFRITAKGTGTGAFTVRYQVSGTAVPGVDYTISGLNNVTREGTTTITLNNGTVTRDLTVTVINDALLEELETIKLTLIPDAAYALWLPKSAGTMLLRDDDQPTVFVDGQVGTGGNHTVAESATGTVCKFWISRTGSTASALTVNYSMTGTATNGVDYTTLSGTVLIPAGAPGVDVSFNTINDTVFEGTESVILSLEAGSYARGSEGRIHIIDNESGGPSVAFVSGGGAAMENVTEVGVPVRLSEPSAGPVTVEYSLEAGARTPTALSGLWVRVVKTGTAFESFLSSDGVTFNKVSSTHTLSGFPANYLAGIAVSSAASGTQASFEVDSLSVTGLSVGGSQGARLAVDLGASSPPGASFESGGLYSISSGGPDISLSSTSDGGRIVYFSITNSANCTVTARVLGMTCTNSSVKAGVMIRETTATNARHFTYIVDTNSATRQIYRTTSAGNATSALVSPTYAKPHWLRLQRVGDLFTAFTSTDGVAYSPIGGAQNLPLAIDVLIGLAASARSDGLLTQASFEDVNIIPNPVQPLLGRAVGFVDEPGEARTTGTGYTVTASGSGIMPTFSSVEDEGHFLSVPMRGDFVLTARLTGISGGGSSAQGGLMVRESTNRRGRALWFGLTGSGSSGAEFRARLTATTSGEGSGVDYTLEPGVLTFAAGETEKVIPLQITNDAIPEPTETVNILLSNANRAVLGALTTFTHTLVDDDGPISPLPVVGFAGGISSGSETVSPALIPVVLSRAASEAVTIHFTTSVGGTATADLDYSPLNGTLTFSPGETVKFISLPLLNDTVAETDETVMLSLSEPAGAFLSASSAHVFTLIDDDTPVVTIAASTPTAFEGGSAGAFTVSRTGSTASALTVTFTRTGTASSGTDFTAFSPATSLTFPVGQASVIRAVAPLQDTTAEIDETVVVTLTAGSGYWVGVPNQATVVINDDDVNTITLEATDGQASEAGNNPGELRLSRAGSVTAARAVTLTIAGTATAGDDFVTLATSQTFAIGQSVLILPVSVLQDTVTEGTEEIVVSIATSSSYIIGASSVANVSITDDDLPPSVFVSSPASKSPIIANGNGLWLTASGSDDGLPAPLSYTWSQLFGPGDAHFENAASFSTGVTFSQPGVYGLRVTVNDGQFSATDDLFVQAGGFALANWISQDQGPPSVRGVAGEAAGTFTVIGSGTGYSGTNDSGHMLFRQLLGGNGDATITARLTSLSGPGSRLAGITVRDTSWRGARRVNLLVDGAGNRQRRTRTTNNTADTATILAGASVPVWLRLERSGGSITALTAPDQSGVPGEWTQVGSAAAVSMGNNVVVGLVVSSGVATSASSTAMFDQVTVTPAFSGSALHSEDVGNATLPGDSSVSGGITTLNAIGTYDGSGGHFRYQQVWGDCMVTARLLTQTGTSRGSQAGVGIRDTTDNAAHGFYGSTTIDGFQVHWRSSPGGSSGTLQTGGSIGSWVRLIRRGNSLSAFRAADAAGAPGTWAQVSGNLPAAMTGPLLVGLVVDSNSDSLTSRGTFSGLSIEPLNTAPVVAIGTVPEFPPFALSGLVVDDGRPSPPGAFTVTWTQRSGPGIVSFSDATQLNPLVTLAQSGQHQLRLTADDGAIRTYADASFLGFLNPFAKWQHQEFTDGLTHPAAGMMADPDHDGLSNLLEFAFATAPSEAHANPVRHDFSTHLGERYLYLEVPKNPLATHLTYLVEATSELAKASGWTSAGLVVEVNTATRLRVRDHVPLSSGIPRFMRVRVFATGSE